MTAVLILLCICLHSALALDAKNSYAMDQSADCNFIGFLEIPNSQTVTVVGKDSGSTGSAVQVCTLNFKAKDGRDYLDLSFQGYTIGDCDVNLSINLGGGTQTFSCNTPQPGSMSSEAGDIQLRLERRSISAFDYNFRIVIRAYRPKDEYAPNNQNPVPVGIIVGAVGGLIGCLVVIAIIVVCCYRQKRKHEKRMAEREYKAGLDEESNVTYGYDNDGRNGRMDDGADTPGSNKKLLFNEKEESRSRKQNYRYRNDYQPDHEIDSSNSSGERKAPLIESYSTSPKKSMSFDYDAKQTSKKQVEETDSDAPKSPILSALHKNSKFRASFAANEAEADERAKRISSYSSGGDSATETNVVIPETKKTVERPTKLPVSKSKNGEVPPPPPLPYVPKSPSPKRSAFASIRRAPRPSSSSEEIQQIERGSGDYDDKDIKVLRNRQDPPSPSEIVPIKVNDPHKSKAKSDTQHTLRPNRGKSPKNKRKPEEETKRDRNESSEDSIIEPSRNKQSEDRERGKRPPGGFQKNTGLRKSNRKSPRVGRASRPSTGSIIDDNESIGRPETPTSQISRFSRDDDLDSNYQPLRRTGSRQSLYASRSSLYGRRGRRERRNSFGESVASTYAHDDLDSTYDDFERVSRRESMRKGYKSMGDLEYESREISTQTLRETGSQTGIGRTKNGASKKAAARKQSTASTTSTGKKTKHRRTASQGDAIDHEDKGSEESKRPARTKSKAKTKTKKEPEPDEDGERRARPVKSKANAETLNDKPKILPKPKPAPRKSASAAQHAENDTEAAPTVPQTTAPVMMAGGMAYPGQMMPGPQMVYPGQPQFIGPGGVPMMQQYPPMMAGQPMPQVMYAPVARMPTGAPQGQPRAPSAAAPAGQPGKSSWDVLCAMTEKEKNSPDNTELASVTGSVYSNQYPNAYSNVQFPPQYPGSMSYPASSFMAPMSGTMSEYGSGVGGGVQYPHSSSSSHQGSETTAPAINLKSDKAFPRQASWEVLNDMAKSENGPKKAPSSHKTESIV